MSYHYNQSASSAHWRAFYTRARAEKKCEHRLKEKEIEVFLPIQTVIRQWKDRKKEVKVPLFRNYIFARVDERERIQVLRTPGIVRCIAFGGVLAEVTQEEIDQIKLLQSNPGWVKGMETTPNIIGNQVSIESGSLRGLKGEVVELRGETRLLIRIASLDMAIKVEVPYSLTKSA